MRTLSSWRLIPLLLAVTVLAPTVSGAAYRMTWVSDIHYDPEYGTQTYFKYCQNVSTQVVYQKRNCDSSWKLVQSAFEDIQRQGNNFTICGGDLQRHDLGGLMPSTVFTPLARLLVQSTFASTGLNGSVGNASVAGPLGNGDWTPEYASDWEADYTERLLVLDEQVERMRSEHYFSDAEAERMKACGFYSKRSSGFRVLSINTLIWCVDVASIYRGVSVSDPCHQFLFIERELREAAAAREKVILVGHIPPSVNVLPVFQTHQFFKNHYWNHIYETRYTELLRRYKDIITVHLYGHTHVFAILAYDDLPVPGFVIPSISPVYGNTPSYLVASFNTEWELESIYQRYLAEDGTWTTGQRVEEAIGMTSSYKDVAALRQSLSSLATNETSFFQLLRIHSGGGEEPLECFPERKCGEYCRAVVLCNSLYHDSTKLQNCTAQWSTSGS